MTGPDRTPVRSSGTDTAGICSGNSTSVARTARVCAWRADYRSNVGVRGTLRIDSPPRLLVPLNDRWLVGSCISQRLWLAGPRSAGACRRTAPRPTRGKMPLRRAAHDGRSGSGDPDAGAQSFGPSGDSGGSGETAPPRIGTPAGHFRTDALALAASRRAPTCSSAPR